MTNRLIITCPKCGKEISSDSAYCEYCGGKVDAIESTHIYNVSPKSRKNILIFISIVLCFVFIGGILYCHSEIKKVREELQVAQEKAEREFAMRLEIERKYELIQNGFVDLGLPSGTWWKNENEPRKYYTYEDAIKYFDGSLPSIVQFDELKEKCRWIWKGNGYDVVGPNEKSIFLPAVGIRDSISGHIIIYRGNTGMYWSSTSYDSDNAWHLVFNYEGISVNKDTRCRGLSVRLAKIENKEDLHEADAESL